MYSHNSVTEKGRDWIEGMSQCVITFRKRVTLVYVKTRGNVGYQGRSLTLYTLVLLLPKSSFKLSFYLSRNTGLIYPGALKI